METLWYDGPSGGEWVPNPTAEQIVERMRRGPEYWGGFGPTGVLAWHEHPPQPSPTKIGLGTMTSRQQLILNRHQERGWYFEYSTHNLSPRRWLAPFDPSADRDEYFAQWTTGETQKFLAGCFVPQAVAERIVSDFITTREPSAAVQWAPFNDIVPRMYADDLAKLRRQRSFAANKTVSLRAELEALSLWELIEELSNRMCKPPLAAARIAFVKSLNHCGLPFSFWISMQNSP